VLYPDGYAIKFTVPVGTADININLLEQGGLNPDNPQYETLITYLENYTDTAVGSIAGKIQHTFNFGDASPYVLLQNFIGTIRTVGLIIQTPFTLSSTVSIGTALNPTIFLSVNSLNSQATYEDSPGMAFSVATNIILSIGLTSGESSGKGIVYIET
jgi:hypothetical protein